VILLYFSQGLSQSSRSQCRLIDATSSTTIRQHTVNHDGWNGANAQISCSASDSRIMHIVNDDFAGWARKAIDQSDGVLTDGTSGTKDFNLAFLCHRRFLPQ